MKKYACSANLPSRLPKMGPKHGGLMWSLNEKQLAANTTKNLRTKHQRSLKKRSYQPSSWQPQHSSTFCKNSLLLQSAKFCTCRSPMPLTHSVKLRGFKYRGKDHHSQWMMVNGNAWNSHNRDLTFLDSKLLGGVWPLQGGCCTHGDDARQCTEQSASPAVRRALRLSTHSGQVIVLSTCLRSIIGH